MGHVGDEILVLGVEVERFLHPGRAEDVFGDIVDERLAADLFDQGAAEDEGRVDVFVGRTRREVKFFQVRKIGHGERLVALDLQFARDAAAGVRHAGGVGEEVLDPDLFPEGLREREILGHSVFQRKLALFNQLQDRHGRELFGDRSNVEERVSVDGRLGIDIGDAVALVEDDVVALHDQHRRSRLIGGEQ